MFYRKLMNVLVKFIDNKDLFGVYRGKKKGPNCHLVTNRVCFAN